MVRSASTSVTRVTPKGDDLVHEPDGRASALAGLLEACWAARSRGDLASAMALAEAAATLAPDDLAVRDLVEEIRAVGSRRAAEPGTRRRVTVMFCDLVGSTELASSLDPEDTREILTAYHETCAAIVRRYDGHVAHLMGDGLLVYFGYPRAHEDDGLRSVMASLEMADAIATLRSPSSGAALDLRVRIGIHTGLAVISEMGSGTWSRPGDITGRTPNLAARVQGAAQPGTIAISGDTLSLVRGKVSVEALGPHSLKGIDGTVDLYRVVSMELVDDDHGSAVAVGRSNEVAELGRHWARARSETEFAVISGEPGIGKTHLVHQVRRIATTDGGQAVTFRCSALNARRPLAPIVGYLMSRLDGGDPHERLEMLADVAESAGVVDEEQLYLLTTLANVSWPAGRAVPDLQPEQQRERTLLTLLAWLDGWAAVHPLLIVVEDLHWADASTVELLRRLVTEPRPHPVMVVVTTREDPSTAPGIPTTVLSLAPLDLASSDALIDSLTGSRFDSAARAMIAERGDGVPLYVRELARMLDGADDALELFGAGVPIPPTLNDLLVARLDAFPAQRRLIEALAVLDRPASLDVLSSFLEMTPEAIQDQLDELDRAGIVRYLSTPPEYAFRHALLRDAAYQTQLLAHRRELHKRSAIVLERSFAALNDDQPHVLGYHHEMAGTLDAAVENWMRAAMRQAGFATHDEAIASFERVIGLIERLDVDKADKADTVDVADAEVQARSGLAASLLASRGYTAGEVADAYAAVRELSAPRDGGTQVAALYGLWAFYHVTGDAAASLEAAEAMVERAAKMGDEPILRAASAVLGYQLVRLGQLARAVALLESGRSWSSPIPLFPHHPGIGSAANLAMAQWLAGDVVVARATIADAVAAAEALTGPTAHFTRAYTHAFAAELYQVAGCPDLAAQHAGRAVQVSAEFGFTSWLGAGMTNLKVAEALLGDSDEAIPVIEYCLGAWRGSGAASSLTQFGLGLALAHRKAGRTAAALETIDAALADADAAGERFVQPELHRVRGELLADIDPVDLQALVELQRAVEVAASQGARSLELRALTSIERHHQASGFGTSVAVRLTALADEIDPSGVDPEPVLADARAIGTRVGGPL